MSKIDKADPFFLKSKEVREKQKAYFSTRTKVALYDAQKAERELDEMINRIDKGLEPIPKPLPPQAAMDL